MKKHLSRDQFEWLLDMLMEKYPDHEVTEWFKRAWCTNDGDSVIKTGSYLGMCIMQYHLDEFDEEDDEFYEQYFGEDDEDEDDLDLG